MSQAKQSAIVKQSNNVETKQPVQMQKEPELLSMWGQNPAVVQRILHDQYSAKKSAYLQRSVGNQALLQRQSLNIKPGQPQNKLSKKQRPRQDYVFIMGEDKNPKKNPFFTMAERYYHSRLPSAIFPTGIRNLSTLLSYIKNNVHQPIGNLYIVTHGHEDGTLSFGLDESDVRPKGKKQKISMANDGVISVPELRQTLHPANKENNLLAQLDNQIDNQTRIRIAGCNIGQNQEMVNLIDEAFGGQGEVIAPTHEQKFGENYAALSGPFMQRPGTNRFSKDEISAIVQSRYSHLGNKAQNRLVAQLFRKQHIDRKKIRYFVERVPQNFNQAKRIFASNFKKEGFKPQKLTNQYQKESGGTITYNYEFEGLNKKNKSTIPYFGTIPVPTDSVAQTEALNGFPNPKNFIWSLQRTHKGGILTINLTGKRVFAYLHHQAIDKSKDEHFSPPETDRRFYTKSTFKPN